MATVSVFCFYDSFHPIYLCFYPKSKFRSSNLVCFLLFFRLFEAIVSLCCHYCLEYCGLASFLCCLPPYSPPHVLCGQLLDIFSSPLCQFPLESHLLIHKEWIRFELRTFNKDSQGINYHVPLDGLKLRQLIPSVGNNVKKLELSFISDRKSLNSHL